MPTLAKMRQPLIKDSKIAQTTTGQPTQVSSMRAGQPVQSARDADESRRTLKIGICVGLVARTAEGAGAIARPLLIVAVRIEAVIGCQIMPFPFAPILFGSHLLVALPAGIPNIDIQKTCEAATSVMVDLMAGSTAEHDAEVCLSSERSAREQLTKDWTTYSAAEKAQCVQPSVYLPSYIEWLTCLEMEKSVRKPDTTNAVGNTAVPRRRQRAGG